MSRGPRRYSRRRSRAQAVVEFAFVAPVVVLMFMGAWTAANLITDNNAAAQATRAGARFGVELGNDGYPSETLGSCQTSANDPCQVDADIIDQMLPIVSPKLTDATVTQIVIYEPSGCNGTTSFSSSSCPPSNSGYGGAYCPTCSEPADIWSVSNGVVSTTEDYVNGGFTLSLRNQTHPSEAILGVEVSFSYTSPTLQMFTQTDSQYTTMRMAPTE
jgi:hypothetical protein